MKRTLYFTVEIPADVTRRDDEHQGDADRETAQMILPALQAKLDRYPGNPIIRYSHSEART